MMEGLEVVETRLVSSGFSCGQGLHFLGWEGRSHASLGSWYQMGGLGRVSVLDTLWPVGIPGFWRVPPTPSHSRYSHCFLPCTQRWRGGGGVALRRKLWSTAPTQGEEGLEGGPEGWSECRWQVVR